MIPWRHQLVQYRRDNPRQQGARNQTTEVWGCFFWFSKMRVFLRAKI